MALNAEFLKKHWAAIAGSLVGILVIYYLYQSFSGGSASTTSSSSPDLSGGATNALALSSAASLQNAQLNAGVETASYSADVANNQTAAALQASLADTAAKLSATNLQTTTAGAVALGAQDTTKTIQTLQSEQAVQQTQIEGSTLESLARTAGQTQVQVQQAKNQVALVVANNVNTQISNLATYSKHFGSDIQKIAPALLAETGQGSSAPGVEAGIAGQAIATGAPAVISAAAGGVSSILTGLFA